MNADFIYSFLMLTKNTVNGTDERICSVQPVLFKYFPLVAEVLSSNEQYGTNELK